MLGPINAMCLAIRKYTDENIENFAKKQNITTKSELGKVFINFEQFNEFLK